MRELIVPREADSELLGNPDDPSIATPIPAIENCNPGPFLRTGFAGGDMKRTQRLSIEFRHREVTVTVEGSTLRVQDSEPDAASAPAACPRCGSPWIAMVASAGGELPAGVDRILRTLQQSGLHMQVSPAGQLRICQRSFEEIKEKF